MNAWINEWTNLLSVVLAPQNTDENGDVLHVPFKDFSHFHSRLLQWLVNLMKVRVYPLETCLEYIKK